MGRQHGIEPQCYKGLSLTVDEPIRRRGGGISTGVRPPDKDSVLMLLSIHSTHYLRTLYTLYAHCIPSLDTHALSTHTAYHL